MNPADYARMAEECSRQADAMRPSRERDALMEKARQQFEAIPTAAPELPGNAATPAKVELGKMLYFDPRRPSGLGDLSFPMQFR